MSVTYRTMQGYPKGRWSNGEFYGETKLKCAWSDVAALLLEIDDSPNWPADYAFGPTSAVAFDAKVEPIARQTNANTSLSDYNHAYVTVLYTTKGPQWVANHGSIEETYGPFAMRVPIDEDALLWADGTAMKPGEIPSKIHYGQEWRVTWHKVAASPPSYWSAVISSSLAGYTNSNTVTAFTSTRTFAPETLLFLPPVIRTTYGIGKVARTTVSVSLQYWPEGWNEFWRAEDGEYQTAKYKKFPAVQYRHYPTTTFPSSA